MTRINLEFDVNAPLAQVWRLGQDVRRIPDWQFDIIDVKDIQGQPGGVGAKYTLVYQRLGRRLDSQVEVTRVEPPHTIETAGKTPLGGFFKSITRMRPSGTGTHVEWQMDYELPGGPVGRVLDLLLFRRAFASTVKKYNENLKALAEGNPAPYAPIRARGKPGRPTTR